jgi:nucleoside-diphosphate-sugar epimerase
MEMHIHEMLGKSILAKGKVTIFGKGENPTNFVSVKDVARLILHCLEHPEHHNQTFEIGGLDNLSRLDIVALYAQKLGKPIKITHVPNGVLRFMSKVIRPFHPGISRVMFLADLFDRTEQRFDVGPLLRVVPMEMRRVSDLVP